MLSSENKNSNQGNQGGSFNFSTPQPDVQQPLTPSQTFKRKMETFSNSGLSNPGKVNPLRTGPLAGPSVLGTSSTGPQPGQSIMPRSVQPVQQPPIARNTGDLLSSSFTVPRAVTNGNTVTTTQRGSEIRTGLSPEMWATLHPGEAPPPNMRWNYRAPKQLTEEEQDKLDLAEMQKEVGN